MEITKAVIVAAGLSSRLYPLTLEKPKGLLKVNGKEILKRSVETLQRHGIHDIAVVVGYKKEMIMEALGDTVTYLTNPFYRQCNNMGSLWFARDFVKGQPFVYLHGDIIYDENILTATIEEFKESHHDLDLVTDFRETDEEAMKVRVTDDNYLIESNKEIPLEIARGEWTGIAYIRKSPDVFKYVEEIMFGEGLNFYDTHAFTKMVRAGFKIYCSSTRGLPWVEVDFLEDYERAKRSFTDGTI